MAVLTHEIDLGIAAAGASAEDRSTVTYRNFISAWIGDVLAPADGYPRVLAVEGETECVENRGLPGARIAGDGEEPRSSERFGDEIDLEGGGEAREVRAPDGEDAHRSGPCPYAMKNFQMSCVGTGSKLAFESELEEIFWIALR